MASFQAKIGWVRQIKRENKNCRFVPFRSVPTRRVIENSKKIVSKFKKFKIYIMTSFQSKIDWGRPRKREKKIIVPIRSVQTHNLKFKKNS